MRQRFENSGTFLNEATRILMLIVAVELFDSGFRRVRATARAVVL